ncbi:MAG: phosphatase PAP2 family protein [Devosia sp.]
MPLIQHVRALWGNWWLLPLLPLLFLAFVVSRGDLRPEHVVVVALIISLAYATTWSKNILIATLPGFAILFGYELVRYVRPLFVVPGRIITCQMHEVEAALFSFGTGVTPSDFFAAHHTAAADLFFAVPYTVFWMIAVGYSVLLFFRNRSRLAHYLWLLAAVHLVAFVIWMVWPVAPPWYVQLYGCAVDMQAPPSPAALLRVDQLLHITYYEGFYSRDPTVFGAMPSLHCAFPTVGLLAAWKGSSWLRRIPHILYVPWMLTASVYLGHHWLLDGLVSIAIVAAANLVITRFLASPGGAKLAASTA